MTAPRLLVISSAPYVRLQETGGDRLRLDKKFLEGMRFYARAWDGPVTCILQKAGAKVPFGEEVAPDALPFALTVLERDAAVTTAHLEGQDVVLCSGDNHRYFGLPEMARQTGSRVVFIIEYILETRLQIIALDPTRGILRKAWSRLWTHAQERRRRRAFRAAAGIQANGYPAAAAYGPLNAGTMMYLDNRVGHDAMATEAEMAARAEYLRGGGPLRLVHSGRLERMKGSQDLIPVARALRDRGVAFRLDIFGTGGLEPEIRAGIAEHGLQDHIHLNGVVDFADELVPFTRQKADIFLACHRQSDPSCTYLESLGCGVAIAGYDNRMWQALAKASGAGWVAPLGDTDALADLIAGAAADRADVVARCAAARKFAETRSFEAEFARRIAHLADLAA